MSLKVTHDGETGPIKERCCMCRCPTNYWHKSDVALCLHCKDKTQLEDLPTKAEWCAKEMLFRTLSEGHGYKNLTEKPNLGICGIREFMFTSGLCVGLTDDGPGRRYCYDHYPDALAALKEWDGTGHPGGPWIKCKGTYLGEPIDLLNPEFSA
jgi:hypothetical protein